LEQAVKEIVTGEAGKVQQNRRIWFLWGWWRAAGSAGQVLYKRDKTGRGDQFISRNERMIDCLIELTDTQFLRRGEYRMLYSVIGLTNFLLVQIRESSWLAIEPGTEMAAGQECG
jgi:hypothetical protein